ncbi:MAG: diguanylate cyclase [Acidobacteriaceae bacterium]
MQISSVSTLDSDRFEAASPSFAPFLLSLALFLLVFFCFFAVPLLASGPGSRVLSILTTALGFGGIVLMARLTNARTKNLGLVLARLLLLAFLVLFAAERLAGLAGLVPLPPNLRSLALPRLIIASAVALAAALLLPRLRGIRESEALARKEHASFLAAAEHTLDDFYLFEGVPDASGAIADFRFTYINPNAERRLGVPRESLYGKILTEVRPFMIRSGLIDQYREVVRTGVPYACEVFIDDEMIQGTWLNVQVVKLGDGIAITSRDVTEHRRRSDQVHYLAHHDHLTGLANRTLLHDRLRQAISRAAELDQKVAVFLLDLDDFKRINDSLGHVDGDRLLATVGQRLLSSVRESDTVARIGGDEFVIVMPDFRTLDDVRYCGQQIIRNAAQPIHIGDRALRLTLSVGVATYPEGGVTVEELLRNADAAMYAVKDSGRNSLCLFDESLVGVRATTA